MLFRGSQLVLHGRFDAERGIDWCRFGPVGCDAEDLRVDPDRRTRCAGFSLILTAFVSCVAAGIESARVAGVRTPEAQGLWRLVVIVNAKRDSSGTCLDQPSTAVNGRGSSRELGMIDLPGGGMGSRLDGRIPSKTVVQHAVETRTNQRTVVTRLAGDHYRQGHSSDLLAARLATGAEQLLRASPYSFALVDYWLLSTMQVAGGHAWQRQQSIPGRILGDDPYCKRQTVPGIHLQCYPMPTGGHSDPEDGDNLNAPDSHKMLTEGR